MDKPHIMTLRLVIDCSMTAEHLDGTHENNDNNDNGSNNVDEMAMLTIMILLQLLLMMMVTMKDTMTMAASSGKRARYGQLPKG